MHFPTTNLPPERSLEPPALVHIISRSDVMWNRPVFKAPPLSVTPPHVDASIVVQEVRRLRAER